MNKYDIISVIGEGAYGIVLKCRNKETGEVVAIKKFKESDEDAIVKKTTLREVKTLRTLQQENIVNLKEAFRRKQKLYLVFEYVERTLLEVLEEQPRGLRPDHVRQYVHQIVQAVRWCHQHHIIHRDIKPENLLISQREGLQHGQVGKLKLCDFGFARQLPTNAQQSITDYVSTRWYRAPELLLGSTHYGKEVDIWAIGCIMSELIEGQPLFPGESDIDQLYIIQRLLGPLIPQHQQMFMTNARFAGLKFPEQLHADTLEKRFAHLNIEENALSFLKWTLRMNPQHRPTCEQCLAHPYLSGIEAATTSRPPTSTLNSRVCTPPAPSMFSPPATYATPQVDSRVPPLPLQMVRAAVNTSPSGKSQEVSTHAVSSKYSSQTGLDGAFGEVDLADDADSGDSTARRRKRMASSNLVGNISLRGGGRRDIEEMHAAAHATMAAGTPSISIEEQPLRNTSPGPSNRKFASPKAASPTRGPSFKDAGVRTAACSTPYDSSPLQDMASGRSRRTQVAPPIPLHSGPSGSHPLQQSLGGTLLGRGNMAGMTGRPMTPAGSSMTCSKHHSQKCPGPGQTHGPTSSSSLLPSSALRDVGVLEKMHSDESEGCGLPYSQAESVGLLYGGRPSGRFEGLVDPRGAKATLAASRGSFMGSLGPSVPLHSPGDGNRRARAATEFVYNHHH